MILPIFGLEKWRISEVMGCPDSPVIAVPEMLDGYRVTSVSECAFCGCAGLVRVALPEGLREIGETAFDGCFGHLVVDDGD